MMGKMMAAFIVEELNTRRGHLVAEQAFDYLDAPPKRVTPPHTSVPYSRPLEDLYMPSKEKVVAAALSVLE